MTTRLGGRSENELTAAMRGAVLDRLRQANEVLPIGELRSVCEEISGFTPQRFYNVLQRLRDQELVVRTADSGYRLFASGDLPDAGRVARIRSLDELRRQRAVQAALHAAFSNLPQGERRVPLRKRIEELLDAVMDGKLMAPEAELCVNLIERLASMPNEETEGTEDEVQA